MPTDANGTYTLPPSYFVQNGDPIQPVQHNPPLEDIAQGLTSRVMRDGRAAMTGDLNMDAHKVVGLAPATAPGEAATFEQAVPPGAVMAFARNSAPMGWLECRGQAVSRTTYAGLFAAIGTTFGPGDGSTTFGLPNLLGMFVRGWNDAASGYDQGRVFGSAQASQNLAHSHGASTGSAGVHTHTGTAATAGAHTHSASTGSAGNHDHSGTTNTAGNHFHYLPENNSDGDGNNIVDSGPGSHTLNPNAITTTNGDHSHILNINAAGSHTHTVAVNSGGAHTHSLDIASAGAHTHAVTVQNEGGPEARPNNIALLYCIKT